MIKYADHVRNKDHDNTVIVMTGARSATTDVAVVKGDASVPRTALPHPVSNDDADNLDFSNYISNHAPGGDPRDPRDPPISRTTLPRMIISKQAIRSVFLPIWQRLPFMRSPPRIG